MKSRSFLGVKALIVLVSVVVAFLLPVASGPFSAVYGPATALRAIREVLQVQSGIMLAALVAAFLTFLACCSCSMLPAEFKLVKLIELRC